MTPPLLIQLLEEELQGGDFLCPFPLQGGRRQQCVSGPSTGENIINTIFFEDHLKDRLGKQKIPEFQSLTQSTSSLEAKRKTLILVSLGNITSSS